MSARQVRLRADHIAELTRDHQLPLEPVPEPLLLTIADTLIRAWKNLLAKHPTKLQTCEEAEATDLLRSRLCGMLAIDPIWETLVRNVERGAEVLNYDGSRIEVRPDLSIYLTRRDPRFQLVVECKVVNRSNRQTVNRYARQGLLRFVKGDYAWTSREAFMLAYVRDGSTLGGCLRPFLDRHRTSGHDPFETAVLPGPVLGRSELSRSSHARRFLYSHEQPSDSEPGPVDIWHLWLVA